VNWTELMCRLEGCCDSDEVPVGFITKNFLNNKSACRLRRYFILEG